MSVYGQSDMFAAGGLAVSVMVPLPLPGVLDYRHGAALEPGTFVTVPVGGKETLGVVWAASAADPATLKPVLSLPDIPPMSDAMRAFIDRAAYYTMTPPGMLLRQATRAPGLHAPQETRTVFIAADLPPDGATEARRRVHDAAVAVPGLSASDLAREAGVSAGVVKALHAAGGLLAVGAPKDRPPPRLDPNHAVVILNDEQQIAATLIADSIARRGFAPIVLEGVTGSGKTETYLEAVAEAVKAGRQALILLPEIALTADFIRRMRARFGAEPVAWHSGLTPVQRRKAWRAVASGQAQVVAGARSALFLPFPDLALTVVDEEHDQSYKQDDVVRYQARDLAVLRASIEGATVVLASATPSLETWVNAETGKYARATLTKRHGRATLPLLSALDLKLDPPERGCWIAPPLNQAIAETLAAGEQALLFLNRRGYAPLTICRACGWRAGCPNCDAWLVEHRAGRRMLCHQCGHAENAPRKCPDCGEPDKFAACGPGVERIAEEAAERFPTARLSVLSSDLAGDPKALEDQIRAVARGEADIIVGTQIVAKGHNFPLLTLVGVVDADIGLAGGDLRAAERTFQMLDQVSGRAGRAERPGRAILQTVQPDHPVLRAILDRDVLRFRETLARERRDAGMPPFARLVAVIIQGEEETAAWDIARALGRAAGPLIAEGTDVWGPAPAPFAMLRGKHRVRFLLRFDRSADHHARLAAWLASVKVPSRVRIIIDVDPYNFL